MKKEKNPVCKEAVVYYYDFLTNEQGIPAVIRQHMEVCSFCLQEVRRLQEELAVSKPQSFSGMTDLLGVQMPLFDRWVGCEQAKPFLAVFAAGGCPKVPTPAAVHVEHCPACREDLKTLCSLLLSPSQMALAGRYLADDGAAESRIEPALRQVLSRIRQRPSSNVLTCIRRDEKTGEFETSVEIKRATSRAGGQDMPVSFPGRWARRGLAAAVLLIAFLLLWRTPAVRGLDLTEVYQALGNVLNVAIASYGPQLGENVAITSFGPRETEPLQQIWISNAFDIQLYIEKDRAVLWDLSRQQRIIKTSAGQEVLPIPYAVKKLEIPWGLLPFRHLSELPSKYRWQDVQVPEADRKPDTMVYDLTWTDLLSGGREMQRRWRGYLNAYTKLPYRIEWWDKLPGRDFEKMTTMIIAYPENEEVLNRIHAEGFDYLPTDQR